MKTCKKLFSLLLVAVMLVAAIPFAAMAAPIGTAVPAGNPGITVKVAGGNAGGQFIYKAGLPENFDPALTEHLTNVLVYGNYDQYNANTVQVVSGNWDVNTSTLTINVKNVYTVKISGDATATGANKLDSVAYADYGQLTTTLTNAGLSEYLNSAKWKIVTPIVKDDTNFTLTVPVEKVVPPTTEPTTEPTTPPTTEPTTPPTTEPTTPPTTEPTTTPTPASYSKVVVVYCDENGNVKTNAGKTVILTTAYTGSTANNDAQGILNHAGIGESVSNYAKAEVAVSGDTITVTLTDKADTRYVLNLTVVTGTTTTTKTYRAAYTGNVDTMSVLKGFGVDKDFNLDNYTYSTLGYDNAKTFTLTMTAKPTAADKYTVNCVVNGTQFASKTDVTYVGSFESNITNAQAITLAARLRKLYVSGSASFTKTNPWYKAYSDYAIIQKIITSAPANMNATLTRQEFASILAKALPDAALPAVNTVANGAIPDVYRSDTGIYKLYRAGILAGSDSKGTFRPNAAITRAEVAAVLVRMADPNTRQLFTLQ